MSVSDGKGGGTDGAERRGPDVFCSSAMFRRDQSLSIILSACELLKTDLTGKQKAAVRQVLFSALRIYLEGRADLRPGCAHLFLRFRTPLHWREALAFADEARRLTEELLSSPREASTILERTGYRPRR
jgi:hypothetical protein